MDPIFEKFENLGNYLLGETSALFNKLSNRDFMRTYLSLATELDGRTLNVLTFIVNNANKEGVYEGTYETLMAEFNISRMTLSNSMAILQKDNLISKVNGGWKIAENIKVASNNHSIVISFRENESPELSEEAAPVEKLLSKIDVEDFKKFFVAFLTSKERLHPTTDFDTKTPIDESLVEVSNSVLVDYNENGLKAENTIGYIVNAVKLQNLSEDDENTVLTAFEAYIRNGCFKNVAHVDYAADFQCADYRHTLDYYVAHIPSELDYYWKMLAEAQLLGLVKANNNDLSSCSYSSIRRQMKIASTFNNGKAIAIISAMLDLMYDGVVVVNYDKLA